MALYGIHMDPDPTLAPLSDIKIRKKPGRKPKAYHDAMRKAAETEMAAKAATAAAVAMAAAAGHHAPEVTATPSEAHSVAITAPSAATAPLAATVVPPVAAPVAAAAAPAASTQALGVVTSAHVSHEARAEPFSKSPSAAQVAAEAAAAARAVAMIKAAKSAKSAAAAANGQRVSLVGAGSRLSSEKHFVRHQQQQQQQRQAQQKAQQSPLNPQHTSSASDSPTVPSAAACTPDGASAAAMLSASGFSAADTAAGRAQAGATAGEVPAGLASSPVYAAGRALQDSRARYMASQSTAHGSPKQAHHKSPESKSCSPPKHGSPTARRYSSSPARGSPHYGKQHSVSALQQQRYQPYKASPRALLRQQQEEALYGQQLPAAAERCSSLNDHNPQDPVAANTCNAAAPATQASAPSVPDLAAATESPVHHSMAQSSMAAGQGFAQDPAGHSFPQDCSLQQQMGGRSHMHSAHGRDISPDRRGRMQEDWERQQRRQVAPGDAQLPGSFFLGQVPSGQRTKNRRQPQQAAPLARNAQYSYGAVEPGELNYKRWSDLKEPKVMQLPDDAANAANAAPQQAQVAVQAQCDASPPQLKLMLRDPRLGGLAQGQHAIDTPFKVDNKTAAQQFDQFEALEAHKVRTWKLYCSCTIAVLGFVVSCLESYTCVAAVARVSVPLRRQAYMSVCVLLA